MERRELQKLRQKAKETTEREWIRDSIALRNKKPEETLKISG